ncbi:MAG: aspartate--tRNA ligase [Flavobacteriales bacterium]|nr:aspartate--tRNA ligase [Flavobacteriales bacterium]MAX68819.1 aspartate--tRNA ligase [Flavobacteriales bacterium]|tara:strand:+ start:5653 stop:7398 length:1746 start_codon:yes stop_codon:yes gene_type:complete
MLRTKTCGELNISNVSEEITLSGWVQKNRDLGGMTFVDLRDRYGITQLAFNMHENSDLCEKARKLGREFVIQVNGEVIERSSKNTNISTGEIEIKVTELTLLNASKTPPFTIEDETDGGDELRMKYRYLDIRRAPIKENIILRSRVASETRKYLDARGFYEIETPYLIKSTPEGARDFVVPSRMNEGQFYALPQSPQTFKQLLMVAGMDKYYQIVRCFRDEDLRADRQPEFTQIDCEMAFVEQEDILNMFEGLTRHLLKEVKNVEVSDFPRMTYDEAMKMYGSDKPDIRFGMKFIEMNDVCQQNDFVVFDSAELVVGINVKGGSSFTRKELDTITDFVKTPQIGAKGLVYCKCNEDGTFKSSVDKFFSQEDLNNWADKCKSSAGDLILVMAGETEKTRKALSNLRLHLAEKLGLRNSDAFAPLWVLDFPLLEWDEETEKYHAMHHPFTSPKQNDIEKLDTDPSRVRANAYDLVLNGNEIGGGSIRIHDKDLQKLMFKHLGFTEEQAKEQFGFLMDAFEYGAPPHGGVAFGFDRLCAIMGGQESIRDFIAFPKNNSGRDVMIDSPANIDEEQLKELNIKLQK